MDVKTLCLGALSLRDLSGYEIRKEFDSGPFSFFQEAGFGSIYPALKKLVEEGLATSVDRQPSERMDKKVYRITAKGREALFDAVSRPPGEDRLRSDFLFTLFFADLLPPRHVDQLVSERMLNEQRMLEAIGNACDAPTAGADFVRRLIATVIAAGRTFLEEHRHELVGSVLQSGAAYEPRSEETPPPAKVGIRQ